MSKRVKLDKLHSYRGKILNKSFLSSCDISTQESSRKNTEVRGGERDCREQPEISGCRDNKVQEHPPERATEHPGTIHSVQTHTR